ncbi:Protein FAM32A [Lachnellula arida]|uniref:Protein FAM32A n=1 Tax=Lachnellula arida TaxID=1316785 RepID=A0A8T9AXR6_9HELO|nr:Protein FAM32A [Lachnellula arida]
MPSDDYTPTVRGGLKLKGSAPTGIKKKKKSKTSTITTTSTSTSEPTTSTTLQNPPTEETPSTSTSSSNPPHDPNHDPTQNLNLKTLEQKSSSDGKTPSERAYEETRRKRLADRIAREGPKTHKQRVEELNKYLSTLSEHHDMPRIGPG